MSISGTKTRETPFTIKWSGRGTYYKPTNHCITHDCNDNLRYLISRVKLVSIVMWNTCKLFLKVKQ